MLYWFLDLHFSLLLVMEDVENQPPFASKRALGPVSGSRMNTTPTPSGAPPKGAEVDATAETARLTRLVADLQTQLKQKNVKLQGFLKENSELLKQLNRERESNEADFASWSSKKTEMDAKIKSLNEMLLSRIEQAEMESSLEMDQSLYSEEVIALREENEKLYKRLNVLQRENDLECQTKNRFVEQLEELKSKHQILEEEFEELKLDFDDLSQEHSLMLAMQQHQQEISEELADEETNEDFARTPTLNDAPTLDNHKIRHVSSSTSTTLSHNLRQSNGSLIQSQIEKYLQIIRHYEFVNKGLEKQNELLCSYIKSIEWDISQLDTSDEAKTQTAMNGIKKIWKSASLIAMRTSANESAPFSYDEEYNGNVLSYFNEATSVALNDNTNVSFTESLACSTDYENGNVTNLYASSDFSLNEDEDGDDEGEEEAEDYDTNVQTTISAPMNKFASTDSLNGSYKVSFGPRVTKRESKMLMRPSSKHVKKLTKCPSSMKIKGPSYQGDEYYNLTSGELSKKSSVLSTKQLIFNEEPSNSVSNFKIMGDDDILLSKTSNSMFNISEVEEEFEGLDRIETDEDEEPGEYSGNGDGDDDADDDDDERHMRASNKEIREFEGLSSVFCAKHSLVLCLCHQRRLVNNLLLQSVMDPFYRTRNSRRLAVSQSSGRVQRRKQAHKAKQTAEESRCVD